MGEQPGAGPAAVDGQARHRRLRHRLAAAAGEGRADVADHLESAGDVVQRLGDVLAHLAHRPAAGRTDARRRVHHVGARQMLRQPTATAPALHLRRHSRRFVWAFARRLVFFQFFQRQLELADHVPELLRGSAEGLPFRTRQPSDDAYGEPNGRNTGEADGAGGLVGAPQEAGGDKSVRGPPARRFSAKQKLRAVSWLLRENGLLAPHRIRKRPDKAHDGTITTEDVDVLWGTDMTQSVTLAEGVAHVFVAVDHCNSECVGIHADKSANRFQALEPVRQGVRRHFGAIGKDVAAGLMLRHDHGPNYMSDDFQSEIAFLGIEASPSFVRQPEGNGVAERFIRTLKENLLWVRHFATIEELRLALLDFAAWYNTHWLVARHGHRTPAQVRADQQSVIDLAA